MSRRCAAHVTDPLITPRLLAVLPAFADGRVHALGPESFRLDRFAAMSVLDRLAAAAG